MNKYEHLLYKRGFLLTNITDISFRDRMTMRVFKKWNHLYFGKFNVYLDPSLQYSYYKSEQERKVLLIGLVINPFRLKNDHKLISKELAESRNEEEFLDYLDELTGRFTIITYTEGKTSVYGDAGGTRTLYYDNKADEHIISSHSSLIGDVMGYTISKEALEVLTTREFTGRKYLPGLMSPFKEVKPLTPNTRYIIEDRYVERFFPRQTLKTTDFEDTLNEVTNILIDQSKLVHEMYKTSTSLTAGLDSRLTFAIQGYDNGNKDYFTHLSKNKPESFEEDVRVGKVLADLYDKPHNVYEYTTDNDNVEFKDFKYVWLKNVGMYRGSVHLFKEYADKYPSDRLHIRSNLAEIVRVYYKSREGQASVEKLTNLYTKSDFKYNQLAIESFKDFIETTKFKSDYFYNYNFADLFYWEHRMGM